MVSAKSVGQRGLFIKVVGGLIAVTASRAVAQDAETSAEMLEGQTPRYELRLDRHQFFVLHSGAASGVGRYGGDADSRVKIAKRSSDTTWIVTIINPRLIEVWEYWMAERIVELRR